MRAFFLISMILLISLNCHARVFNLYNQSFGAYVRGSAGISNAQQDAFLKTSGSQTQFTETIKYSSSLELGFMFPTPQYSFLLGFQVLHPQSLTSLEGKKSDGSLLMNVDSRIYGFFPVAHFDYFLKRTPNTRVIFSLGGGYGKVSVKNSYNLTPAGSALYSASQFNSSWSQYAYTFESSLGYEFVLSSSATMLFNMGYRYAKAHELKYDQDTPNFAGGTNPSGSPVKTSAGDAPVIDLGGIFAGISFQFYFNY